MLDYSETLENVYLALNPHIGLKNKKIENLVHLTFNGKFIFQVSTLGLPTTESISYYAVLKTAGKRIKN